MNTTKIIKVDANDNETFQLLYDSWALTWEGLREEDFTLALQECYEQGAPEEVMVGYHIKGRDMNEHYNLTGDNKYPDDLNILAIANYGGRLAFQYGARWFTDIVDNNELREKELNQNG